MDNPLAGNDGAARIFGPQKGATPQQVEELERGLENLGRHVGDNDDQIAEIVGIGIDAGGNTAG